MFVRKKRNRSGSTSIQLISKKKGKYVLVEMVGGSFDSAELEYLALRAAKRTKEQQFLINLP